MKWKFEDKYQPKTDIKEKFKTLEELMFDNQSAKEKTQKKKQWKNKKRK